MPKQRIEPARLKPGVTAETLPGPRPEDAPGGGTQRGAVTGRALIFWDPHEPGKKRDAIRLEARHDDRSLK